MSGKTSNAAINCTQPWRPTCFFTCLNYLYIAIATHLLFPRTTQRTDQPHIQTNARTCTITSLEDYIFIRCSKLHCTSTPLFSHTRWEDECLYLSHRLFPKTGPWSHPLYWLLSGFYGRPKTPHDSAGIHIYSVIFGFGSPTEKLDRKIPLVRPADLKSIPSVIVLGNTPGQAALARV